MNQEKYIGMDVHPRRPDLDLSCFLIKCTGGISRGNLSLKFAQIFP